MNGPQKAQEAQNQKSKSQHTTCGVHFAGELPTESNFSFLLCALRVLRVSTAFLGQCVLWLIHSVIPTPGASREAELARGFHPLGKIDRYAVCDQQTPRELNRRRSVGEVLVNFAVWFWRNY